MSATINVPDIDIDVIAENSWKAYLKYKNLTAKERGDFLRAIGKEIENLGFSLIETAMEETNLPQARLEGERARTIGQLNSYAAFAESGQYLDARIDTANADRTPPKPDIRKLMVPLGPVVVFGASNFPFAFSTAGGDTASALAAGCPVIVKGHSAHAKTSVMVAEAVKKAAITTSMPDGVFDHVLGSGSKIGQALVKHPRVKAVGFTGSTFAGKALFALANSRKEPIPVFAEMGSINPVFLMPQFLKQSPVEIAKQYAGSITMGVGQFCTNPGLIFALESPELNTFVAELGKAISAIAPAKMLHPGIAESFQEGRAEALNQDGVNEIASSAVEASPLEGIPTVATVSAESFLHNPVLHKEVFGPYSLVVRCKNIRELHTAVLKLEGQLTATLMATEEELAQQPELVSAIQDICGRLIMNGVPTGVEVCLSMQHGGPYPATTDSRFTSVGADAIKRFIRPVSFQNWPNSLLPQALQNENPLGIWRTVNNQLTKDPL